MFFSFPWFNIKRQKYKNKKKNHNQNKKVLDSSNEKIQTAKCVQLQRNIWNNRSTSYLTVQQETTSRPYNGCLPLLIVTAKPNRLIIRSTGSDFTPSDLIIITPEIKYCRSFIPFNSGFFKNFESDLSSRTWLNERQI